MNEVHPEERLFALIIQEMRDSENKDAVRFVKDWNSGVDKDAVLTIVRSWIRQKEREYDATPQNKQS